LRNKKSDDATVVYLVPRAERWEAHGGGPYPAKPRVARSGRGAQGARYTAFGPPAVEGGSGDGEGCVDVCGGEAGTGGVARWSGITDGSVIWWVSVRG